MSKSASNKKKNEELSKLLTNSKTIQSYVKDFQKNKNSYINGLRISAVLRFIIFSIFFLYVINLERDNCECSIDWKREYVKYFSLTLVIFSIIEFIFPLVYSKLYFIQFLLGLGGLAFIFIVVSYIRDLKRNDCRCSKDWKRTAMEVYAWISIILLVVSILFSVFVGALVYSKNIV